MTRLAGFALGVLFWSDSANAQPRPATGDAGPALDTLVCGPKCVRRVLEYYGTNAALADLIHEIQWPDYERGSNMASVAKALRQRGIHVLAVTLPTHRPVHWQKPV